MKRTNMWFHQGGLVSRYGMTACLQNKIKGIYFCSNVCVWKKELENNLEFSVRHHSGSNITEVQNLSVPEWTESDALAATCLIRMMLMLIFSVGPSQAEGSLICGAPSGCSSSLRGFQSFPDPVRGSKGVTTVSTVKAP